MGKSRYTKLIRSSKAFSDLFINSNMAGVFRLPDGYITEDLRWDIATVKEAFQELSDIKFLTRDDKQGWLVIHQFLKWNPIQNPKQGVGVQKFFQLIPRESTVRKPFVKGLLQHGKYLSKEFLNELESEDKGLESVFEKCGGGNLVLVVFAVFLDKKLKIYQKNAPICAPRNLYLKLN